MGGRRSPRNEAGRLPALNWPCGLPYPNLGYLPPLMMPPFASRAVLCPGDGQAGPHPGPPCPRGPSEIGFLGGGGTLRDNSFIIREVSLAENLGPVTESLSYGRVATGNTGCV